MHRAVRLMGCSLATASAPSFRPSMAAVAGVVTAPAATVASSPVAAAAAAAASAAWRRPLATAAASADGGGGDGGGEDRDGGSKDGGASGADTSTATPAVPEADYGSSLDVGAGDAEAVRQQVEADAAREAVDNPAKEPADAAADVGGDGTVYADKEPGKE